MKLSSVAIDPVCCALTTFRSRSANVAGVQAIFSASIALFLSSEKFFRRFRRSVATPSALAAAFHSRFRRAS